MRIVGAWEEAFESSKLLKKAFLRSNRSYPGNNSNHHQNEFKSQSHSTKFIQWAL